MLVFKKVSDLRFWLQEARVAGKTIGFTPTMGALHEGHLGLVRASQAACDRSVVSIFVNPTQFNQAADLETYPRMPDQDIALLEQISCDALFLPPVEEVYPPGEDLTVRLDFGLLDQVMEGRFRPGHFGGMATVVKRLLDIVQPDRLYMGQKDFQQLTIVRDMLYQLNYPVKLVMGSTTREPDGLAMSSRNLRLTPEMRAVAPVLYQTMEGAKKAFPHTSAADVCAAAVRRLEAAGLKPEYYEIVDGITLQPVVQYTDSTFVVVCVAAWAGDVRLIDNMVLKGAPEMA
ncbi:MAG: pantoate--beta-alanine ligase [Bacteroidetes bacterium]|nr:MAG: pantoate--beta-alanine ligase [Bacteroidota bacterium]